MLSLLFVSQSGNGALCGRLLSPAPSMGAQPGPQGPRGSHEHPAGTWAPGGLGTWEMRTKSPKPPPTLPPLRKGKIKRSSSSQPAMPTALLRVLMLEQISGAREASVL